MVIIGMDVHVRNSYLQVSDEAGRRLKRGRVSNTLDELAAFLGPFEDRPMTVSLESTTNSRAIVQLLERYGEQAGLDLTTQVLDARRLRIIAESVNKSDKVDAAALAELTRSGLHLPRCYVPDQEVFALREHLRQRADLVRVRTMLKNRVHALLHRRGVCPPARGVFTGTGRRWLAELALDEAGRCLLDQLLAMIDQLEAELGRSDQHLAREACRQRWCASEARLRTMPGVGRITALTVLSELGELSRFTSRSAVANYAGLVPVQRQSNEKQTGGGVSKRGSNHLRRVLIEAAWQAVPRSVKYGRQYASIKGRGGSQKAITAVARKMLEDMYTLLKNETVFRESAGAAG